MNNKLKHPIKIVWCFTVCFAFATMVGSTTQASIVNFVDLNTDLTAAGNTLSAGTGTTSVTGVNGGTSGITYSVTHTDNFGAPFGTQTLTFDVAVTAVSGSTTTRPTATTATAILGTTANSVDIITANGITWRPTQVGGTVFLPDETLVFNVLNASVTGGFAVNNLGFTNAFFDESTGVNHTSVIGEGTAGDLFSPQWSGGSLQIGNNANFVSGEQTLIITGRNGGGNNNLNWGVQDVDFQLEIVEVATVPEPTSLAVLAFGGLGMLIRRRR